MPESVERFLRRCQALKHEPRRGWRLKVGVSDPESVADHSFGVALLALVCGDLLRVDTCRLVRMALVHDLAEVLLGDAMPEEYGSIAARRRAEAGAFEELLRSLPRRLRESLGAAWAELTARKTPEARLLWELDRLEMGLQARNYAERGFATAALQEFVRAARRRIRTPLLRGLLAA
jgi:putative hydrolase of HD superfamily